MRKNKRNTKKNKEEKEEEDYEKKKRRTREGGRLRQKHNALVALRTLHIITFDFTFTSRYF